MDTQKIIILSGPSGAGKTTIAHKLLEYIPELTFSISATTRNPRGGEINGKDYYFISIDDFKNDIQNGQFVEYEEVYQGLLYGTKKSEIERIWEGGKIPILDIDVKGALNIKKQYPKEAIIILIHPVNLENLEKRLRARGTETEESIQKRLSKAQEELNFAPQFDAIIYNDNLDASIKKAKEIVFQFLTKSLILK